LCESLLDSLMNIAVKYCDRIDESLFLPQVNWRNARNGRNRSRLAVAAP
jgi:UDP-sulfoquinovose synthase